ncbi:alpha/beta hydrolase [Haloarculaceae archaeon H-GB2-1]|nr:alpha/beta hydrolase [Haloarculaceae archaeon H-GB1-1]MEA5388950.1 alpha/beta hydrolase [Haloarculaceae archaeon H-GB11]MEA5407006.1 alpha/beta hydrolase [Haloarculaceae archaeon H-GB2-1]
MPTATNRGVDLYYDVAGDGETVAFVNDVGYGAWLWGWQHAALAGPHETLTWDLRGTGRSDAPAGPYDVRTLAADLEAVLKDHAVRDVHLVGAGLGGMVALEYGRRYGRAETLTLFGTAASGVDVADDALDSLFAPRDDPDGLRSSLENAFAADVEAHPEVVEDVVSWRADEDADSNGWESQAAAMRGFDASDWLYEVTQPAQVFHGVDDAVVPASAGERLAEDLPRGEYRAVEGGHLCFIEEAAAVNDALVGFLDEQTAD